MRLGRKTDDERRMASSPVFRHSSCITNLYEMVRGKGIQLDAWIILSPHMWPLSPRRAEALGQTRQRPWSIQGRHDYLLTNCVA
jgi:hypothetical protein